MKRTRRLSDTLLTSLGARLVLWMIVTRVWLADVFTDGTKLAWHFDEHFYFMHEEVARITMLRFHELAAWNPFQCGGIPGIGNPQDVSLSPDFVLRLIFGTGAGRRLAVVLFAVLGMEGTFRLARRYDAAVPAAALAAVAFGASGRFSGLVGDGWVFMFAFELMPWAVLGLERGVHDRRGWIGAALVMAWLATCAGTYSVPYTGLLLASFAAGRALVTAFRSRLATGAIDWRGAAAAPVCLAKIALLASALGAVRILPMIAVIRALPRYFYTPESNWPGDVIGGLALREGDTWGTSVLSTSGAGWNYIGTAVCALAVLGVLVLDRRALFLGALAILFGGLACGVHTAFSPWSLVHRLPIFSQLRSPYRFVVVAGLLMALIAARGLTRLEDTPARIVGWWRRKRPATRPFTERLAASALGAAVTVGIAVLAARGVIMDHTLATGSVYGVDGPAESHDGFRQSVGNRWDAHVFPAADRGVLACFEETEFPQSTRLRGDAREEERADPPASAHVVRVAWSPNRVVLHVDAPADTDVLVNQNFHPAWRASVGDVFSKDGLLAVHVPAGSHDLVLVYRDPRVVVGAILSVIALAYVAATLWPSARRRARAVRILWTRPA